uniref:Uncharacterized protein n=1 Tax=Cajanus cajan TaxID=3821 RepID=A0A151UFB4_CAJCA
MAELMQLRQKGSVVEYHEAFDAIVSRLDLDDEHRLSCFLGGLKQEVQMLVRMFQPNSLRRAFTLVKMQEATTVNGSVVQSWTSKPPLLPTPSKTTSKLQDTFKSKQQTSKTLTLAYMSERREKGLCYFCDEPFTPEHGLSHKKLQLHLMEVDELQDNEEEEVLLENSMGPNSTDPQISVHAFPEIANFQTMCVTGYHKKKPLHVLNDSDSTHNFLDIEVVKRLGCRIDAFDSLVVVDGTKINVSVVVKRFQWTIQQTKFTYDMLLIPLGCCDLVLGVEWLVSLGDIVWNFNKLQMECYVPGKRHVLRGASSGLKIVKKQ